MENKLDVKPLLSAIVPVGNLNGDLTAIDSWIQIAVENHIEVILVLDEGDEATKLGFEQLILKSELSEVRVARGRFGSPGFARNAGIPLATGKWIAFWDSDDFPNVHEFMSMVQEADEESFSLAVGNFAISDLRIGTTSEIRINAKSKGAFHFQISRNPGLWRWAFKREIIEKKRFTDFKMGEDILFLLEVLNEDKTPYKYAGLVYTYRRGLSVQLTAQEKIMEKIEILLLRMESTPKLLRNELSTFIFLSQSLSLLKRSSKRSYIRNSVRLLKYGSPVTTTKYTFALISNWLKPFKSPTTSSVAVGIVGGLGNQLFQLATGLAVAGRSQLYLECSFEDYRRSNDGTLQIEKFELPPNVLLKKKSKHLLIQRKLFNFSLRISSKVRSGWIYKTFSVALWPVEILKSTKIYVNNGVGFDERVLEISRPVFLVGYFQNSVLPAREYVYQSLMKLKLREKSQELLKLEETADRNRILVIHVRQGDYHDSNKFGILKSSYYERALTKFNARNFDEVWVFSDQPLSAMELLRDVLNDFEKVKYEFGLSAEESFELMRHGSGYIIANSSFSWWSAFLRYNVKAEVVAPKPWFKGIPSPRDIYSATWMELETE